MPIDQQPSKDLVVACTYTRLARALLCTDELRWQYRWHSQVSFTRFQTVQSADHTMTVEHSVHIWYPATHRFVLQTQDVSRGRHRRSM